MPSRAGIDPSDRNPLATFSHSDHQTRVEYSRQDSSGEKRVPWRLESQPHQVVLQQRCLQQSECAWAGRKATDQPSVVYFSKVIATQNGAAGVSPFLPR